MGHPRGLRGHLRITAKRRKDNDSKAEPTGLLGGDNEGNRKL